MRPVPSTAHPSRNATISLRGISTSDRAADWLSEHGPEIHGLRTEHGAVLIRDLPLATVDDFARLRDSLINRPAEYVEQATPRSAYGNGVFTATDFPAQREIALHNENSYALSFPALLVFGCLVAPDEGGATILGDMRALLDRLPDRVVDRFRATGWTLVRNYWPGLSLSWSEAFGTTSPDEVQRYADAQRVRVEWLGDRLRTSQTRSAVIRHPETGAEVWFNHIAFWSEWSLAEDVRTLLRSTCGDDLPFQTRYGDGEIVSGADIDTINREASGLVRAEPWRPGDLLLVDNVRMAHGRQAYKGSRQVLVAMGDPVDRDSCELPAE